MEEFDRLCDRARAWAVRGRYADAERAFRSALALMQLPDAAANRRLLGGGDGGIGTTLARMTAAMAAQGLIEQQPRLDGLLVSTLVDEA